GGANDGSWPPREPSQNTEARSGQASATRLQQGNRTTRAIVPAQQDQRWTRGAHLGEHGSTANAEDEWPALLLPAKKHTGNPRLTTSLRSCHHELRIAQSPRLLQRPGLRYCRKVRKSCSEASHDPYPICAGALPRDSRLQHRRSMQHLPSASLPVRHGETAY